MRKNYTYSQLVDLMKHLRGPRGCPWDRKQTHKSLLKYLKEESAEVADAVRQGDPDHLCEELGDVLLQVLFHAQIATERGHFTMADVVDGLAKKLVRRHPHVFGSMKLKTAAQVVARWKEIKQRERDLKRKEAAPHRRISTPLPSKRPR
ncbi:MAG: MazG family protein [Elusimicrobia bacterium]|jgi:MazG family protein|nr:MazG family protein [Elusimicrobiota bacterium]